MATMTTEKMLEERLQQNPDSLAFSRLADIHRKAGNISRAIALCTKGVEQHPAYVTGRIILGRCYLEQEDLDKAVDAFTTVCRIDRRNIVAIKMLADIFLRQGLQEKAGDLYTLLARMDPYNEMLVRSASQMKGTGAHDLFEILGVTVEPVQQHMPAAPVPEEPPVSSPESAPPVSEELPVSRPEPDMAVT
ncbi:MAG: tetratricopeptide repeat protein, partial [Chitinispirillaceae bacterium]|nr:tetratricopeptide repeat protein [Chitinispirillaceae bacterium]